MDSKPPFTSRQTQALREWHVLRRTTWFSKMMEASRNGEGAAYDIAKKQYQTHDAKIQEIDGMT